MKREFPRIGAIIGDKNFETQGESSKYCASKGGSFAR
jgi:hypothetical protein